jgi:hypothetical protein
MAWLVYSEFACVHGVLTYVHPDPLTQAEKSKCVQRSWPMTAVKIARTWPGLVITLPLSPLLHLGVGPCTPCLQLSQALSSKTCQWIAAFNYMPTINCLDELSHELCWAAVHITSR